MGYDSAMTQPSTPRADLTDVRVALTGATGFVGSFVLAQLVADGAKVFAVDGPDRGLRPHLTEALAHPAVTHIETPARWPYRTEPGLEPQERMPELSAVLGDVDAVVHFAYHKPRPVAAGRPLTDVEDLSAELRLNALPGIDLLELLSPNIKSFCFASSGLAYGHGHDRPVNEDVPARGDTGYGLAKLAVEQAVTAWGHQTGTGRGTSLRIVTVYGPGETAPRAVPNFIRRGLAGEPPRIEVADDRRDYISAWDVASGVSAVVANHLANAADGTPPCDPVLNIATGHTYSTGEVAELVLEHLGADIKPVIGPADRPPLKHEIDSGRLQSQTGWRPTMSLVDGLSAEVEWFRDRPDLW